MIVKTGLPKNNAKTPPTGILRWRCFRWVEQLAETNPNRHFAAILHAIDESNLYSPRNVFGQRTLMSDTQTTGPVYSDFADDPDFEELLEMFAETIEERQGQLRQQFRDGSVDEMRVTAHQLKGAGGGYGFDGLSSAAAQLEEACKENDVDRVGESLDALLGYMQRIQV